MKIKITLFLFLIVAVTAFGQECKMYFPTEEGTEIEMKDYDAKDKLTGSTKQKITKKEVIDDNVAVSVYHQSFDKKGEMIMDGEMEFRCEAGIFYMDMKNMLDGQALSAYENMEVEVDANDMAFPFDMDVGTELPDADIAVKISSDGVPILTVTVKVTNRKIEARESITTPAGTFDCLKMSFDIETKMMIKVVAKAVQWMAENIGVVRSESYNKKGKLQGFSVLSGLN